MRQREELRGERGGIVAGAALEPRAILGRDERGQRRPVVVRRNRREAAAADDRDAGSLRFDASTCFGVVGVRNPLLFARPHLQCQCALAGLRKQLLRLEAATDLSAEPEPVEAAGGEHDGVEAALAALAQPGVDVAAERLDPQVRLEREQLRAAADGGCAYSHPRAELRGAA